MKALMNILCITIEQTDNIMYTQLWLNRFERFVKHLLIVSELSMTDAHKSKNEQQFASVQRKFAEAVAFAFAFLFHEVNSTATPKSAPEAFGREFSSPQEKA